jgi:two-component system chemotaxis sensor kinase CheA
MIAADVSGRVSGLDRVTADIQVAVMRTRMQPLEKILGKVSAPHPRPCGKTGKKIELVIEGAETEVDKSVHRRARRSARAPAAQRRRSRLEPPADRASKGKPETGRSASRAATRAITSKWWCIDDGAG